jgi:hypothetical protein
MTHRSKLYFGSALSILSPFDEQENHPRPPMGESHGVHSPSTVLHVVSRGALTGSGPAEFLASSRRKR